ncbi:hypothetical protein [Pseudonocardia sp. MH-G8]|uniref:hypothetical protein n=1 Tax=Pseudonocardia sp. MH-G8 TaxID=1854588 RepID=UPI000BA1355E|nr:hypothetical protein [Pseudonocardia sp. MH-G8]OZM81148.1 hypothetical protein CFP66_17360 [Pseudonocardia sp. MH-G8]
MTHAQDADITDDEAESLLAEGAENLRTPDDDGEHDDAVSEDDDDPRLSKARKDAATYRERLRDAEAERDALREELSGHRTNEVVRLAEGAGMRSGADLLAVTSLEALRDTETGRIDPEKVTAAARDALSSRPHWRGSAKLPARPTERLRGTGDADTEPREASWADLLQPGR